MTEALELKLVQEFPTHFRDYNGNPLETCMAFGCEHQDGWFQLFYDLNKRIAYYLEHINPSVKPDFYWSQIKEKFGTARWYYNGGDDIISDLISYYEGITAYTCETCGEPGKLRGKGWYYTSCNEHAKAEHKDKEDE